MPTFTNAFMGVMLEGFEESLEEELNKNIEIEKKKQQAFIDEKDIQGLVEDTQLSLDLMPTAIEKLEKLFNGEGDFTEVSLKMQRKSLAFAYECFNAQKNFCNEYFGLAEEKSNV